MIMSPHGQAAHRSLRRHLERILPELGLDASSVADVRVKRSQLSTSYDTGVVTIHLHDDTSVKVFFKNYDQCVRIKNDMRERRQREVLVYEELLSQSDLGTAAYYGTVWDDDRGWHWLLLEYVEGVPVSYCEVDQWIAAADWLGRLHGHYLHTAPRLATCDWLIRHDADFLTERLNEGLRSIVEGAPHLRSTFEPIVDRYAHFVEAMTRPPFTLVHGAYRPQNVMACPGTEVTRMCAYDWEEAAFGSPYYDLAYLIDGFEPPVLERFFQRYVEGADRYGMPVLPKPELLYVVNCFRLHMIVNSLSRARLKGYSEPVLAKLVAIARDRYEQVGRSAGARA